MKTQLKVKLIELNNKARKGKYAKVYDPVRKVTRYYKYKPKTQLKDYKMIYQGNKEYNKKYTGYRVLNRQTEYKQGTTKSQKITDFMKSGIKRKQRYTKEDINKIYNYYNELKNKSVSNKELIKQISKNKRYISHTFDYRKGFAYNHEMNQFFNKATSNPKFRKIAIQSQGSLSQFLNVKLEMYGYSEHTDEKREVLLATVICVRSTPQKVMNILNNHDCEYIRSDPDELLEDLKANANANVIKNDNGKITRIRVELDMRFGKGRIKV